MILAGSGDAQGRREAFDWAIRTAAEENMQALVLRGLVATAAGEESAAASSFFMRALDAASDEPPFQKHELRAIAEAALGHIEEATQELAQAIPHWTPADKYRRRIYELLGTHDKAGAQALIDVWQNLIDRHPASAEPWG
jgi:tetratricopeptide (TPR) repeat protein